MQGRDWQSGYCKVGFTRLARLFRRETVVADRAGKKTGWYPIVVVCVPRLAVIAGDCVNEARGAVVQALLLLPGCPSPLLGEAP